MCYLLFLETIKSSSEWLVAFMGIIGVIVGGYMTYITQTRERKKNNKKEAYSSILQTCYSLEADIEKYCSEAARLGREMECYKASHQPLGRYPREYDGRSGEDIKKDQNELSRCFNDINSRFAVSKALLQMFGTKEVIEKSTKLEKIFGLPFFGYDEKELGNAINELVEAIKKDL